jgi:hypothetical protein
MLRSVVKTVNASYSHRDIWESLTRTYNPDQRYNTVAIEMEQDVNCAVPCFFALRNQLYYNSETPTVEGNLINMSKLRVNY